MILTLPRPQRNPAPGAQAPREAPVGRLARPTMAPLTAVRVYYDFETTGFLPAGRVVQFGALTHCGRRFDQKVNPGVPIPPSASEVHRIYDAHVCKAPGFAEAWRLFLAFLDDVAAGQPVLLLGWRNWSFDDKLLHLELTRCGQDPATAMGDRVVWTADGIRALQAAVRCKQYTTASQKLGVVYADITGQALVDAHDAVADCTAVRAVLPHFEQHLECCPFAEIGFDVKRRTKQKGPSPILTEIIKEAGLAEAATPERADLRRDVLSCTETVLTNPDLANRTEEPPERDDLTCAETDMTEDAAKPPTPPGPLKAKAAPEPRGRKRRVVVACSCGRVTSRFFDCLCSARPTRARVQ